MQDGLIVPESEELSDHPMANHTQFFHSAICPKCQEVIPENMMSKHILFLRSENEILSDEL